MALHLRFAPSADQLLVPFGTVLRDLWSDPFDSPVVVVPNPSTGDWLQLRMAESMGAVANLRVQTLENFLWRALSPDASMQMLDAAGVGQVVAVLLRRVCLEGTPEERALYAALLGYAAPAGVLDEGKLLQLSLRLGALLSEYEYNRPGVWNPGAGEWLSGTGMDQAWLAGERFFPESVATTDAWQSDLYRRLFSAGSGAFAWSGEPTASRLLTLPQLHRLRHSDRNWKPGPLSPTLLAQVSKISHFHRNLLLELSWSCDLHVFLTNPCAEFWEDVDTCRSNRRGRRSWAFSAHGGEPGIPRMRSEQYREEDLRAVLPDDTGDNRLLQLWGHTGKENITLWCQAAEYDFEYQILDEPAEDPLPLLGRVQQSLLQRQPLHGLDDCAGDSSLRVFEAPTRVREVENMRSRLLDLLEADPQLRLDQVAVYVTDVPRYLSALEQVFGAYAQNRRRYIPYAILGKGAKETLVAQGLQALLAVWNGDFSRGALFRLLRNPLVMNQLGVSRDDVEVWESWAAQMQLFRAYDREHRLALGEPANGASDEHTFAWGISRLLLGGLASGTVDLGMRTGSGDILGVRAFRDFETGDGTLVLRFVEALERLFAQERYVAQVPAGTELSAQWKILEDSIAGWLDPAARQPQWDAAVEFRCWQSFRGTFASVAVRQGMAQRTDAMGKEELLAQLRNAIPQETPSALKGWSGCLTIAPLRSGHLLPHRHVFVLGLDGDLFPGMKSFPPLDLISCKRIVGDPDPVRDNRYAFLEILHAARVSLTLSFRAQNIQKDAELLPSSVLLELETALLEAGYPPGKIRSRIPLLQRDEERPWDPYEAGLRAFVHLPKVQAQRALYRLDANPHEYADPAISAVPVRGRLTRAQLSAFLTNPYEYHLKERLGWRSDEDAGTLQVSDEPLQLDALARSRLDEQLFLWVVQHTELRWVESAMQIQGVYGELDALLPSWVEALRQGGELPESWFGLYEATQLRERAQALATGFAKFCLEMRAQGMDMEKAELVLNYSWSLTHADAQPRTYGFAGPGGEIEISGSVPYILRLPGKAIWVLWKGRNVDQASRWLNPWLQACLVRLGGWNSKLWAVGFDTLKQSLRCEEFMHDSGVVDDWLTRMARQMLVEMRSEHLPLQVLADQFQSLCKQLEADDLAFAPENPDQQEWFHALVSDGLEPSDSAFSGYRCYLEDWELGEPRQSLPPAEVMAQLKERYGLLLPLGSRLGDEEDAL